MAPSEAVAVALAVDRLVADDAAAALRLSDGAGWNQTIDDWRVFIEQGDALGCRDHAGRLIATAASLRYDGAVGWISMVLVDAAHRQRGLATALLERSIAALRSVGRVPVLDATPAGAAVYARLGFSGGYEFERWERGAVLSSSLGGNALSVPQASMPSSADIAAAVRLDAAASGVGRASLICALLERSGSRLLVGTERRAFAMARVGRRAVQIGPVVADTETEATALLADLIDLTADRIHVDVPTRCRALAASLSARGFERRRSFRRMALGATPLLVAPPRVFAVAGPEFG